MAKDVAEESHKNFRGFSGAQQRDPRARPENAKFRNLPMSFVSAGASGSALPPKDDSRNAHHAIQRPADVNHGDLDSADEEEEDDDGDDENDDNIQTNIVMDVHLNMDMDNMQIDASSSSRRVVMEETVQQELPQPAANAPMEMEIDDQPTFVVDTIGDSTLDARGFKGKLPVRRAVSPARSDSSGEVIFSGRNNKKATVVNDPVTQHRKSAPSQNVRQESPHPTDDLLAALSQPSEPFKKPEDTNTAPPRKVAPVYKNGWASRPSPFDTGIRPQNEWVPAPDVPYWKKQPTKARPDLDPSASELNAFQDAPARSSKVQFAEAPESVSNDIAGLQADWKATLKDKKKAKKVSLESEDDGASPAVKGGSNRRGKRGRKQDNRNLRRAIDSEDEDSNGEAAYDDYMENLIAQMAAEDEDGDEGNTLFEFARAQKASANLGPSMVVDGKEIGDDELLPKPTKKAAAQEAALDAADDDSEWESDSSALHPNADEISSDEDFSLDSSELEEDVEYTERQQWEDEDDIRQRRIDRMTDEQIARLLAKQEEFGMAGDEILIEDGAFSYTPEEGVGDVEAARVGLYNITNNSFSSNKHGMRLRSGGDRKHNFPDASALADTVEQYGEHGFDIMDFERPSLRPTKKGRKGRLPPELETLSDEELKENLQNSWSNDRSKKAQKKQEREQLRREGLLGSAGRKGKADLNAKYPLGMTMVEVHHEIKTFLQDEELLERSFPPLGNLQRKSLHEIALALNMNSRSQGAGKKRFPVLYKTSRTEEYSPDMFERIMHASGHGFLTRGKAKKMAKGKAGGGGSGPSRGKPMMHVANGQIVGAGAAEIGQESMGHKLMMKMGWSKGQGLGKEGEGMKTPVEQKVRLGTAGLG